jgi:hypothetical protein
MLFAESKFERQWSEFCRYTKLGYYPEWYAKYKVDVNTMNVYKMDEMGIYRPERVDPRLFD